MDYNRELPQHIQQFITGPLGRQVVAPGSARDLASQLETFTRILDLDAWRTDLHYLTDQLRTFLRGTVAGGQLLAPAGRALQDAVWNTIGEIVTTGLHGRYAEQVAQGRRENRRGTRAYA